MFNKIILMGHICSDLDFKMSNTGVPLLRFRIAVNRGYAKQGEERQSDFFNVTAFRNNAEFGSKYFQKGSLIIVEGQLQNNNYTDKSGILHYADQIIADSLHFGETRAAAQSRGIAQFPQPAGGGFAPNQGPTPPYQPTPMQQSQPQYTPQYAQNQYQQAQAQQPPQQPAYSAAPPPQQPAPNNSDLAVGSLDDFEEIISGDGNCPF
jgi:single-strand DNA-binding protein